MDKIDFKKTSEYYKGKNHILQLIDIPPTQYLMIDGQGDPNTSEEYTNAIAALYPVAYKIKFASKLELKKDFVVMPLECLWWADDMNTFTSARDKSKWKWTAMIMQPDWVTRKMFIEAVKKVSEKAASGLLDKVRLETLDEGMCVQTLHIGSFDDEAEILEKIHKEFIPANKLKIAQKHHEIYLSDFRKTPPQKLKTILRQPVIIQK